MARMKRFPAFRWMWLLIALVPKALSADTIIELRRYFPDVDTAAVQAGAELFGRYESSSRLGKKEAYLFPDYTYAYLKYSDIGVHYEEGDWTLKDGVVTLITSGAIAWVKSGRKTLFTAVHLSVEGEKIILAPDAAWNGIQTTLDDRSGSPAQRLERIAWAVLKKMEVVRQGDVARLKRELDDDHGRFSLEVMMHRFRAGLGESGVGAAGKNRDGSFYIKGETGQKQGLAEVTIAGVRFLAPEINVNRAMTEISLIGPMQVIGGPVPEDSKIIIFHDGKKWVETRR